MDIDVGQATPPGEITLRGRDAEGAEWAETFYVDVDIPAATMWELEDQARVMAGVQGEIEAAADGEPVLLSVSSRQIVMPFLEAVMVGDSFERFEACIRARRLSIPSVMAVMEKATELIGGRPTPPSPRSSGGRGNTGRSSQAELPSPATASGSNGSPRGGSRTSPSR